MEITNLKTNGGAFPSLPLGMGRNGRFSLHTLIVEQSHSDRDGIHVSVLSNFSHWPGSLWFVIHKDDAARLADALKQTIQDSQ